VFAAVTARHSVGSSFTSAFPRLNAVGWVGDSQHPRAFVVKGEFDHIQPERFLVSQGEVELFGTRLSAPLDAGNRCPILGAKWERPGSARRRQTRRTAAGNCL